MQTGSVWVIDENISDQQSVKKIFSELQWSNELVFIKNATETLRRFSDAKSAPFIMLCEVNLPIHDGFYLRAELLRKQSKKFHSVPFIFWSTKASEEQISKAYDLSAHGFFIKGPNYLEMKENFIEIMKYWQKSRMPAKSG